MREIEIKNRRKDSGVSRVKQGECGLMRGLARGGKNLFELLSLEEGAQQCLIRMSFIKLPKNKKHRTKRAGAENAVNLTITED